jgi:formate-dependent phosphoribosylglycinamide formyltransferase (GAR transformylase)
MVVAMATTTMQLEASLRDELAGIARDDFAGVPLAEALRRLIKEHRINKIMARYAELRSNPQEWASYRAEASLTDAAASDGLPAGNEEYPEYDE